MKRVLIAQGKTFSSEEQGILSEWVIELDDMEMDEIKSYLKINAVKIRRAERIKMISFIHERLGINEKIKDFCDIWLTQSSNEFRIQYTTIVPTGRDSKHI